MLTLLSQLPFSAVTPAGLRAHLNLTDTSQDAYLQGLIDAARSYCERSLNLDLAITTWKLTLPQFPLWGYYAWDSAEQRWPVMSPETAPGRAYQEALAIRLPRGPLNSVNLVQYLDGDGVLQTVDPASYYYATGTFRPSQVVPVTSWPWAAVRPDAVQVTFTSGFSAVPPALIHAIKLLAGLWFEVREDLAMGETGGVVPNAVENLLGSFRPGDQW